MLSLRNFDILFLNNVGKELTGDDAEGKKCFDVFKTSDCQTERCACARAMRSLQKEVSETDAHPGGHELEIEYYGLPICDKNGNAVGAFEIVVDQTEIKNMLKKIIIGLLKCQRSAMLQILNIHILPTPWVRKAFHQPNYDFVG